MHFRCITNVQTRGQNAAVHIHCSTITRIPTVTASSLWCWNNTHLDEVSSTKANNLPLSKYREQFCSSLNTPDTLTRKSYHDQLIPLRARRRPGIHLTLPSSLAPEVTQLQQEILVSYQEKPVYLSAARQHKANSGSLIICELDKGAYQRQGHRVIHAAAFFGVIWGCGCVPRRWWWQKW